MSTETVPTLTISELRARVVAIEAKAKAGGTMQAMIALGKEYAVSNKALNDALDATEGDMRLRAEQDLTDLGPVPVPDFAHIQYTLRRNEDGKLHVESATILGGPKLLDHIYDHLGPFLEEVEKVSSIKVVTFDQEGAHVNGKTSATSSKGGPRAPRAISDAPGARATGWVKDGQTHSMGSAFDLAATPEEKAHLEGIRTGTVTKRDGSPISSVNSAMDAFKRQVIGKAGYVQNK